MGFGDASDSLRLGVCAFLRAIHKDLRTNKRTRRRHKQVIASFSLDGKRDKLLYYYYYYYYRSQ
jgi:hypothetical protein